MPERLTAEHLRVSEKIKIINPDGMTDNSEKFFKADTVGVIDPKRELEVSSRVESIMQTLKQAHSDKLRDLEKKINKKGVNSYLGGRSENT